MQHLLYASVVLSAADAMLATAVVALTIKGSLLTTVDSGHTTLDLVFVTVSSVDCL